MVCGETVNWPFGTMDHGWVGAKIDGENLSVQIFAGPGKSYNLSKVEVATEVAYFPLKGGALSTGQIQERDHFDNEPYLFPLSLFGTDCEIFIAAWAIITPGGSDAEHWAGDMEFVLGNPNRGLYFSYCFDCQQDDSGDVCESAYMATGKTLNSYYKEKPTNTNWGWYYEYNAATEGASKTFELWAAAGQNDLNKGTLVGHVTVNSIGTVNVVMIEGYSYSNLHVYVADGKLPAKRPAPGSFKNYSETGTPDGIFTIIVHLEVCW